MARNEEDSSSSWKNGSNSIDLDSEEFRNVKKLSFKHCPTISHLLDSSSYGVFNMLESLDLADFPSLQQVCNGSLPDGSFQNLTDLKLYEMPSLMHLWKNPERSPTTFTNLKSIDIRSCKTLPYLFTLSTAKSFVQLEELRVLFCGMMEEILFNDLNGGGGISVIFPNLKKLVLHSLPRLMVFCRGTESMKFPHLEFLSIRNLPKLLGFPPGRRSLAVFFSEQVKFDSLRELSLHGLGDFTSQIWPLEYPQSHFAQIEKLHICACNKLKNLFLPRIARALPNLKELVIMDCLMMTDVIANDDQEAETTMFPSLEKMELWQLRSLRSFCRWKQDLHLPSLSHVKICMCREMQTFTLGSLHTPRLEHLEIENKLVEIKQDLNGAIRGKLREKLQGHASSSTATIMKT